MLQCESRKGLGSWSQAFPGEVWAQMRASLTLLTHQYQGAGLAWAMPGSKTIMKKSSRVWRIAWIKESSCQAMAV